MGHSLVTPWRNLGLSKEDMARIRSDTRRRRVSSIVLGGIGTVAAMAAGYASAHIMYYEPAVEGGAYPFVMPLAAVGVAARMPGRTVLGIAVSMVTGFILMFATTAAAYTQDPPALMYGAYDRR